MGRFSRISNLLDNPDYDVSPLINEVKRRIGSVPDHELAFYFGLDRFSMSRLKTGKRQVNSDIVLSLNEKVGLSFDEIRKLIGVPDARF